MQKIDNFEKCSDGAKAIARGQLHRSSGDTDDACSPRDAPHDARELRIRTVVDKLAEKRFAKRFLLHLFHSSIISGSVLTREGKHLI
mmetsp:Transcript_34220/g.116079  ORF Transcript_34220/g.116079 Transcript_34220/m.116079 type:complete len:87 (+) Transcript_34220:364-624(+)